MGQRAVHIGPCQPSPFPTQAHAAEVQCTSVLQCARVLQRAPGWALGWREAQCTGAPIPYARPFQTPDAPLSFQPASQELGAMHQPAASHSLPPSHPLTQRAQCAQLTHYRSAQPGPASQQPASQASVRSHPPTVPTVPPYPPPTPTARTRSLTHCTASISHPLIHSPSLLPSLASRPRSAHAATHPAFESGRVAQVSSFS